MKTVPIKTILLTTEVGADATSLCLINSQSGNQKCLLGVTIYSLLSVAQNHVYFILLYLICLSLWLIGTVRAEPETVISRAWVQSPDPAK